MSNPKTRVRWTDVEKRTLAAELLAVRQADPSLSQLEAVLKAQAALPKARQRQISAWAVVKEQLEPYLEFPGRSQPVIATRSNWDDC